ncbi:hypothetical protein [Acidovorax sacchari]|uniref:hypothetical protein n=1 Tax=Acidovorax sacchari TaxID=3230736 RepID=UPI0039E33327
MSDTAAGRVVDEVMVYLQRFEKLMSDPAVSREATARMLPGALKAARRGLDAVPFLNVYQLNSQKGQIALRYLPQKQAFMAGDLAGVLIDTFDAKDAGGKLKWRMHAAEAARMGMTPEFDRELSDYLTGLDGTLQQLEPCMDAASVSIRRLGARPDLKTDQGMARALKDAVVGLTEMRLKRIERHLDGVQLCIQRLGMEPALAGTPAGAALGALKTRAAGHEELLDALDVLLDARAPAPPEKVAQLQGQLDALLGAARAFVEVAGAQFASEGEDPSSATLRLAPHILHSIARVAGEMEDALGAYKLPEAAARHVQGLTYLGQHIAPDAAPRNETDSPGSDAAMEAVPDTPAPAVPRRHPPQARARLRRQKAHQGSGESSSSVAQDPARDALLQMARERLGTFKRPPAVRVAGLDDVIEMGASLRKNTSALQVYRNADSDPLEAGRQMRLALDSWFGHAGRWKGVLEQLQASQDGDGGAPAKDLLRKIREERIEPLRQLHAQIDAVELDRVKTFAYPRLKHVEHLMQADPQGRSLRVGTPVPLRSQDSASGNRATLFEVALDVGTLANGQPAPPLYVHLHTRQPVTADACRTIAFDDLDAVHVKNAEQRGKGRTWEVLNNALDSVHRGPLDAKVLEQLQQRMARS